MTDVRVAAAAGVDIPGYAIVDVVAESGPWLVLRARAADGTNVRIKTARARYPRVRDLAELRREYEVLRRIAMPSIVQARALVPHGSGNLALITESFGRPLADLLVERSGTPLPLDEFFTLVIRLTRILGALHERHIVHKNVTPGSIFVDPETWEPRLANFGLCSELSLERQSAKLSTKLEGSLPYMSPEQTGRTSRDVDWRADYYSLGVTCFELLTGTLPFEAADPLEWAHRHITQPPPLASERRRTVPEALARIVAKLMAKSAEDRYQSTFGLIADLERCRSEVATPSGAAPFALGAKDVSRRFQIPQRLYGREPDVERLIGAFDDVAQGGTDFALVSGYSGVGKSSLVAEMSKAIVARRGYLVEGKFDQFQQATAYSAMAAAFRGLVDQLLGEPPAHLDAWRTALREGLGANAGLITALVPELTQIIGDAPPVPELPPAEAQTRFQLAFTSFVKVFATAAHPLVLFMDDLQWSDVPTLNLLARLATARDVGRLLIIGAYRDNAVDATHPLTITIDQLRKVRHVTDVQLHPLAPEAVDELVADTLRVSRGDAASLSRVVFEKAQGNPFFVRELLRSLHEDGAIAFDPDAGRWSWDADAVAAAGVGENVVDFLVGSLRRLPSETQDVLQLAACIGGTFDLATLALIAERTPAATAAALQPALQRQAVVPLSESYRIVAHGDTEHGSFDGDASRTLYRFQHDRVQQAAYALIEERRRRAVHYAIGRLMLTHADAAERQSRLIDIVSHLNQGRELVANAAARWELVRLNLDAGRMAVRSAAYESGLGFLRIALELAGNDAWDANRDLMMELGTDLQRCSYHVGDYDQADVWTETLLVRAQSPLIKAEVLSDRVRQYATMGRMRESIDGALAGLKVLGIDIPSAPTPADVQRELIAVREALGNRSIESLIDAPEIADPAARIAVRLIMEVFAASFLSGAGQIFPFLILRNVTLSLRHGNSPEAAFAYAAFGMLLCGGLSNPATGERYGRLGVAMNEKFDDLALKSRIIYVYAMFISHWNHHWSSMTPWFLKGIEAGYQSGDLLYLAYSAQDCILWDPTLDLPTASRETRKYLAIVKDCDYQDSYDSGTLYLQMQLNFQGLTSGEFSMNDAGFDEDQIVGGMRERRFMTGVANYHIYKAEIHLLYGDYDGALPHVEEMDRLVASAMSLPQLVRYRIVAFLVRAALFDRLPLEQRASERSRLEDHLSHMAAWTPNCRENFEHLQLTMEGELARIDGRPAEALALYERAIEAAHTSGFRRDEALANELAARLLAQLGVARATEGYVRAARHLYEQWGAARKVAQLEYAHPELSVTATHRAVPAGAHGVSMESTALDMGSVIKASQTISGEIVVEQLLRTTLQILLENAGGSFGYFVVRDGDTLSLRAQAGSVDDTARALPLALDGEVGERILPMSIVAHVLRAKTPVVLADAADAGRFASDPYIRARRPKSMICVPIERTNRFSGAIYMENSLITGAFTEGRVEVIKLLAAQAAISVENARLYEDQLRLTAAQGRFVPGQFLENLGHRDIAGVGLGEFVAREMSVLFSDLRGFTPLAERLPPRDVIDLLNRYFSRIGVPIAEAEGFVDSYNGDEVMALFPLPAARAVEAGVQMAAALRDFNRESVAAGGPALEMGIGVNSGPLVLGTVGSADRLKCGVVGDTVNTASRIEQLTKRYGARFLIGEQTYARLGDAASRFSLRAVDRVAAKGKAQAMTLYEVLDADEPDRRAAKEATRSLLADARELYAAAQFADAGRILGQARAIDPHDTVLAVLAERCERYERNPPPADWQAVETLDSK